MIRFLSRGEIMKSISTMAAAAMIAVILFGCAMMSSSKQPRLSVSPTIPAAEGTAKIEKAENGNTSIVVVVRHLAEPGKLTPPANAYVVWVRGGKDAAPQNVGALAVDKNLSGELRTTTPLATFDLFITAEESGQAQQPTGKQLLWTSYNR
jgi:hypothetical protein